MNERLKVFAAVTTAMFFWGISFIWTNEVLDFYDPFTIVTFRFGISALLLFVLNIFLKQIQKIERSDIKTFTLLALFQPFLYFVGENYGLKYDVSPTATAVIISTIPLFSPLAAYIFYKERISLINFLGIVISVAGVYLVIMTQNGKIEAELKGVLFLSLAVFSAVAYTVITVKLTKKYNVYTILSFQNLIGVAWFLPFFFIFDFSEFLNIGFHKRSFILILELAVLASTFSYLFFIYSIKKLGITKANIFANVIPVFTAVFSYFILDERLRTVNIIGIGVVILGLFITQVKVRRTVKT